MQLEIIIQTPIYLHPTLITDLVLTPKYSLGQNLFMSSLDITRKIRLQIQNFTSECENTHQNIYSTNHSFSNTNLGLSKLKWTQSIVFESVFFKHKLSAPVHVLNAEY